MKSRLICFALTAIAVFAQVNFTGRELLSRVSDSAVTVNVEPDRDIEAFFEYGTEPGTYTARTEAKRFASGAPTQAVMDKLRADTRYYYRMQFRETGASAFTAREEHTFHTQRAKGSEFLFTVQFDPHMDENSDDATYRLTLANQMKDGPDFVIDLGDTMMNDKLPPPQTYEAVLARHRLLRSYYDLLCHSAPLFLVLGNHEGEWGTTWKGGENELPIWSTKLRRQYYPNPVPDGFFTGSSKVEPFVGLRQNYYAWEWGDALFVVLDPYWYTPVRPEAAGDWSLTLGRTQYDWLKQTLETSKATFKFVFAHNLVGGRDMDGKMRGGTEVAGYLEWGGRNLDESWGFDLARPGWAMPIHQLLVANNVTAFFHGHDHIYARQEMDGVRYQEGPQPSARNTSVGNRAQVYNYRNGSVLDGVGYIRVRISASEVRTEFVRTWTPSLENATRKNGEAVDAATIPAVRKGLAVVSSASYMGGAVAPGSIAAAYADLPADAVVSVKDSSGASRTARVLGRATGQVNFIVPGQTAAGRAEISAAGKVADVYITPVFPALFSANADGRGAAAAVVTRINSDGTRTTELAYQCGQTTGSCTASPIDVRSGNDRVFLSLFGTGLQKAALKDVTASIGGQRVEVMYAGPQGEFEGLDQVNLLLPQSLAGTGETSVSLAAAGRSANLVTVNIR